GMLPGVPSLYQLQFSLDGRRDPNQSILADTRFVSQDYFRTMQIPVLLGRGCREGSPTKDLVVNQSFAALYLGGSPALGHLLAQTENAAFAIDGQIVGIAGNAHEEGLNLLPPPAIYDCLSAG